MSSADLQWQEYNVRIGNLDESLDPRLMTPGQLTDVRNCEYTTAEGSVRKRPGTVLASTYLTTAYAHKLVAIDARNKLMVADLTGDGTYLPAIYGVPDVHADREQNLSPVRLGSVSNVVVRRSPLAADLVNDVMMDVAYVDSAVGDFAYLVYGTLYPQSQHIGIKIVQVVKGAGLYAPGSTVQETIFPYDTETYGGPIWVKAATSGEHVAVMWGMYGDPPIGLPYADAYIFGVVVDCSTGIPVVGALSTVTNDLGHLGVYGDMTGVQEDALNNPAWILAYPSAALGSEPQLRVRRVDVTFATEWVDYLSYDLVDAVSILEVNSHVFVCWYGRTEILDPEYFSAWYYAAWVSATGAVLTSPTTWCLQADIAGSILGGQRRSAICYVNQINEVILFHTQNTEEGVASGTITSPGGFFDAPMTRWRTARANTSQGVLRYKRGVVLWSKPWMGETDGWYQAWCGVPHVREIIGENPDGYSLPAYDFTAVLMQFADESAEEAGTAFAQVLATSAGHLLQEPYSPYAEEMLGERPNWAQSPASVTMPQSTYNSTVEKLGRRTVFNVRHVPLEYKNAPWDVAAITTQHQDFTAGYGRCMSAQFAESAYLAGGVLMQCDGERVHEAGFVTQPNIGYRKVAAGSTAWATVNGTAPADRTINFQALFEAVDGGNERSRSASSAAVSLKLGPAAGDDITLWVEQLTVTMRTYGGVASTHVTPRTIATLYSSEEYDSDILNRWYPFNSSEWSAFATDLDAEGPLVVNLDPTDNMPPFWTDMTNETIYNDSGELDNDPPYGGCTALAVHKERLWVAGGDEGDLVQYSKERVEGRPAEFSTGQSIRFAGDVIVALASLDDALYVLGEQRIYAVYGDGPNATGDPASGFFQVVPVASNIGCISPHVVVTGAGVLFHGDAGMYIITRKREVMPMPAVNTSVDTSAIASARSIPHQTQVRFALDASLADVLVYDWTNDRWATWRYSLNDHTLEAPVGQIVDMVAMNGETYLLVGDGRILREDASYGCDCYTSGIDSEGVYPFRQSLTFGWMDFERPQGHKHIGHVHMLMQPTPWDDYSSTPTEFPFGISTRINVNHAESGTTDVLYWSNYDLGSVSAWDGVSRVRAYIGKPQPAVRLTVDELEPTREVVGTNTDATVVVIQGSTDVLRVGFSAYTFVDLTVDFTPTPPFLFGPVTKVEIAQSLNDAIANAGLSLYLLAEVDGSNRLVIRTLSREASGEGADLHIDSVANGSTLNNVVGFSVGGQQGVFAVNAEAQTGFAIQEIAFEVGQMPGLNRVPANQSR
jgi:hypothetical protein